VVANGDEAGVETVGESGAEDEIRAPLNAEDEIDLSLI